MLTHVHLYLAPGDLTCIWHELKSVQLRTLNRERAEMVIERWVRRGTAPDAAEVGCSGQRSGETGS